MIQHQTHNTTEYNRYPKIFDFIKNNIKANKILSFGCSTGEECETLLDIFPTSKVVGVDNNLDVLTIAKAKNKNINYVNEIKNYKNFDLILAMSVFCRNPETLNMEKNTIYHFSDFEKEIIKLNNCLISNGYLIIFNSNYYFEDTCVFSNYTPINYESEKEFVAKFDKFGNRINRPQNIIFRKK